MKTCSDQSSEVAKFIADHYHNNEFITNPRDMYVAIWPLISNAMFARDKELLKEEKMKTLITLARSISDDSILNKAIEDLNYKLEL